MLQPSFFRLLETVKEVNTIFISISARTQLTVHDNCSTVLKVCLEEQRRASAKLANSNSRKRMYKLSIPTPMDSALQVVVSRLRTMQKICYTSEKRLTGWWHLVLP